MANHPLSRDKKKASRKVRSILRKQRAEDRLKLLEDISQATERDQSLANRLIRKQRGQSQRQSALWVNEQLTAEDDLIRKALADYCEVLANPQSLRHNIQL